MSRETSVLLLLTLATAALAFVPNTQSPLQSLCSSPWHRSCASLSTRPVGSAFRQRDATTLHFFFGRKEEEDDKKDEESMDNKKDTSDDDKSRNGSGISFLGNLLGGGLRNAVDEDANSDTNGPVMEQPSSSRTGTTAVAERSPPKELTPQEQARELRAQAERNRLEAERMDAELTLSKIAKLEAELAKARRKGQSVDELLEEMEALQAKMRGEPAKPRMTKKKSEQGDHESSSSSSFTKVTPPPPFSSGGTTVRSKSDEPVDQAKVEKFRKDFEDSPDFTKVLIANALGLNPDGASDINSTEVAFRMEMEARGDFSYLSNGTVPVFSEEEVEAVKKQPFFRVKKAAMSKGKDMSDDEVARTVLTEAYYEGIRAQQFMNSNGMNVQIMDMSGDGGFFDIMSSVMNKTEEDQITESFFPKCTRKEGQSPTQAQAMTLVTDILPKASFMPSGKPEPVSGGFIVRGISKCDSFDAAIEAIDEALAKSAISDKLSVFFINDYTVLADERLDGVGFDPTDNPPVLLVLGPDVSREPRRLLFSTVSALGIASSWYLSIYPFLLNEDIMKRAEEQMSLADAGMTYDLTWLTDMSLPLFGTFIGIQLVHELFHRLAAAAYKMEVTVPTFVPSLITGITSSVTTFKTPPKNKEAMFDFAIAGPLAGMAASVAALAFGCQLTAFTDSQSYAMFPALPLEILRQSTLGGGIIELVLGPGSLGVPAGALGSSVVSSINIPLHPIAIAGFIGLVINALSLLPIGTTDGGRVGLTLFSRGIKIIVGQIFLLFLLAAGLFGSDLFLFYFSFLIFFQQGNEIPARNEVDDISFSRILLATFAGVVSLLTLIPFS